MIVVHGPKHPLIDPQRIRSALKKGLVNSGAELTPAEVEMFRERRVDGLRPYAEFVRETADRDIQEPFSVIADMALFRELHNLYCPLAEWKDDPRTILLAGGRYRAAQYAKRLGEKNVKHSGNNLYIQEEWADCGVLVFVDHSSLDGCLSDMDHYNGGRFVGKAPDAQKTQ